ncbi:peptidoglycan editing factor PgeF [Aggregatibacter actinomycetemcomitans]|uniref:peptidoglycan editing factor PgeF n=2 Tax=Aggregatibacter actinomycetemcomitans TaxID=714 RepID=UPI0001B9F807|nr:peptidoglycan editing factor PgeF [Aggregatibacter actinomycetemcomitans]AEW76739.1 23S rRNA pseudouridine synthase D [Aggregatibacter actinomycetemcomitans ANH9381]ACX81824.1 laccase [Aggregatibacter actinomycetemcomitans D11S-1]AMQ92688.1 laccase [Aggregatibacter actinomycetemcomitans]KOE56347.1 laccase [Aggregatibacter actinomycetemcomitans serotype b str. I23C]KOE56537.1 laccase [Aggregatibacter actinomycetemcomitans serotype b str. S23A]
MHAINPNWNAPQQIRAFTTLRHSGVSLAPYDSFNLGDHVGDDKNAVKTNRTLLVEKFHLPQMPVFLNQIHSTKVLNLPYQGEDLNADAVYTDQQNQVCLVMTADCLPVLFTNQNGTEVAAAHAGWRGLCDGILEQTVARFRCPTDEILAWLGPAIGPTAFQVGQEVIDQFVAQDPNAKQAFIADPKENGKFLGNLYQIATQRLNALGITQISGGEHCTYLEADKFFSYRRDNATGRMASVIWIGE